MCATLVTCGVLGLLDSDGTSGIIKECSLKNILLLTPFQLGYTQLMCCPYNTKRELLEWPHVMWSWDGIPRAFAVIGKMVMELPISVGTDNESAAVPLHSVDGSILCHSWSSQQLWIRPEILLISPLSSSTGCLVLLPRMQSAEGSSFLYGQMGLLCANSAV